MGTKLAARVSVFQETFYTHKDTGQKRMSIHPVLTATTCSYHFLQLFFFVLSFLLYFCIFIHSYIYF